MPRLPAVCDNCGLVFGSAIVVENSFDATFTGCTSSCPRCGHDARIPDGIYNVLEQTIEILVNSKRSASELENLSMHSSEPKERNASPEEIRAAITEHAPELGSMADMLPKTRSELYGAIQAICAVITTLAAATAIYLSSQQGLKREQVQEIIDKSLNDRAAATTSISTPKEK